MLNSPHKILLGSRTSAEIGQYLQDCDALLVPTGAYEQHGPGMPVWTDALLAEYFSVQVAQRANILVAPTLPIGDSLIFRDYPGTIAYRPSTIIAMVRDYITSLHGTGFRRFYVVNAHSDNLPVLLAAFSELGEDLHGLRYDIHDFWDFPNVRDIMERRFGDRNGGHADETDASILWAINPTLVRPDRFADGYPRVMHRVSRDLMASECTPNGTGVICGDQRLADPGVGRELIEAVVAGYTHDVRCLLGDEEYLIPVRPQAGCVPGE
jgi:creatinine amidohydrolase